MGSAYIRNTGTNALDVKLDEASLCGEPGYIQGISHAMPRYLNKSRPD